MTATLAVSRKRPFAHIRLSSADGTNRIGLQTLDMLQSICAQLRDEEGLRALVVEAEGSAFCLGWARDVLEAAYDNRTAPRDPFACVGEVGVPVIAALSGDAISAGLELALACDLRIAADTARFAFPETAYGLIPLAGGTQRLPRLVGRGRATSMILLGEAIPATTAYTWGLLNGVVPAERLTDEVARIAGVIAARGPIAERFAREALSEGVEMPLARALRFELDLTVILQTTDDRAEGIRAFAEKREPRFTGR